MQVGFDRWEGPMGSGRNWRGGKLSTPIVREDGGAGDGHRGHGQKAGVSLTRWDGQHGVWSRLCGCGLALQQDLWGLCPAGAGLWPSCS